MVCECGKWGDKLLKNTGTCHFCEGPAVWRPGTCIRASPAGKLMLLYLASSATRKRPTPGRLCWNSESTRITSGCSAPSHSFTGDRKVTRVKEDPRVCQPQVLSAGCGRSSQMMQNQLPPREKQLCSCRVLQPRGCTPRWNVRREPVCCSRGLSAGFGPL